MHASTGTALNLDYFTVNHRDNDVICDVLTPRTAGLSISPNSKLLRGHTSVNPCIEVIANKKPQGWPCGCAAQNASHVVDFSESYCKPSCQAARGSKLFQQQFQENSTQKKDTPKVLLLHLHPKKKPGQSRAAPVLLFIKTFLLGRWGDETPSRALQGALPLDPAQGRGPWESRFRCFEQVGGMRASLSSPPTCSKQLVEISRARIFFLNASVQKKNSGNSPKRQRLSTLCPTSLNFIHAKRGGNSNSMRIRKGIIPLRGGLGAGPQFPHPPIQR
ncbi:hypothetical protein SAMN02745702_02577 [Desulfobaculum bizertense DSM 18034]|uniref:Uncharacterized protein n=1 Tax=Desulfobaculum bizertense DSM 18034 TaxID=1121442 RepID=A0A1T4WT77_9BACT|nr:hypothetical protein SAMN02745702_02577 [Desulfobaculum bizertense DSM 18034]